MKRYIVWLRCSLPCGDDLWSVYEETDDLAKAVAVWREAAEENEVVLTETVRGEKLDE